MPANSNGKTYRFLAITQNGYNNLVAGNDVVGIGPATTDAEPNPNAPETMLTEAYTVFYEGQTASVSPNGLIVQTYAPQLSGARPGDVLAILSGSQAGQWREITAILNATTYILNAPITPGTFAVSIDTGMIDGLWLNNTIEASPGSEAIGLVLAGNNFGTEVVGNDFNGVDFGFQITAYASEYPVTWGWTHAPALGIVIDSNTFENTESGALLGVTHSSYIKANGGRVYYSGSFTNNTGIWTPAYLAAKAAAGDTAPNLLLTIDEPTGIDPGEVQLTMSGNTVIGPSAVVTAPTVLINAGIINGVAETNQHLVLTVASTTSAVAAPTTTAPQSPSDISVTLAPVSAANGRHPRADDPGGRTPGAFQEDDQLYRDAPDRPSDRTGDGGIAGRQALRTQSASTGKSHRVHHDERSARAAFSAR